MIILGSDHGGFAMKEAIKRHLEEKGYVLHDCGVLDGCEVDYPDIADEVCDRVSQASSDLGILVCGTGIGMSIAANKHAGIRAALVSDTYSARMAREHNDANVLALGGRTLGENLALEIVDAYLGSAYAGGKHQRRVDHLNRYLHKELL